MKPGFEKTVGCDEWLTPPDLLEKLGPFSLDPCSPVNRPWDTAKTHYTIEDDGLSKPWVGRVFCNPPYGKQTAKWLAKCASHGNAVALVFARTETDAFYRYIWGKSSGILFIKGRLNFYSVSGVRAKHNAGFGSCLIAYGEENARILSSLCPKLGAWCGKTEASHSSDANCKARDARRISAICGSR